jgi:hypothetical protein
LAEARRFASSCRSRPEHEGKTSLAPEFLFDTIAFRCPDFFGCDVFRSNSFHWMRRHAKKAFVRMGRGRAGEAEAAKCRTIRR